MIVYMLIYPPDGPDSEEICDSFRTAERRAKERSDMPYANFYWDEVGVESPSIIRKWEGGDRDHDWVWVIEEWQVTK